MFYYILSQIFIKFLLIRIYVFRNKHQIGKFQGTISSILMVICIVTILMRAWRLQHDTHSSLNYKGEAAEIPFLSFIVESFFNR